MIAQFRTFLQNLMKFLAAPENSLCFDDCIGLRYTNISSFVDWLFNDGHSQSTQNR
jgi:hypothetical protein